MNSSNAKKPRSEQVKILQEVKRTILFRSLEVMEAAVGNTATASDQPTFLRLQASFATASQTPHSFLCATKKKSKCAVAAAVAMRDGDGQDE